MTLIKGDGKLLENIDLNPANVYQEVAQNIAIILETTQKSCPMLREVGIPGDLYGRPMPVIENILVGYIYDQIEENEPRAIIGEISFESDDLTGRVIPIVELEGVREEDE